MHAPDLLPANRFPASDLTATKDLAPHGTTIVAVTYRGGVLIAGDRRATMGNLLASRDTEKVYITDTSRRRASRAPRVSRSSSFGCSRSSWSTTRRSKACRSPSTAKPTSCRRWFATICDAAMQGLAVIPLLVGFDDRSSTSTDPVGSCPTTWSAGATRSGRLHAVGSGSLFAKSSLKKLYQRGIDQDGPCGPRWSRCSTPPTTTPPPVVPTCSAGSSRPPW